MQRSIFLAKLIGPLFFFIGVTLLVNHEAFRLMADQLVRNFALIYISGAIALVAGLAVVNLHNVWVRDWRVAVTIIGWLGVIGGIVRIVVPQHAASLGAAELTRPWLLITVGLIAGALGAWLSYIGYLRQTPRAKRGGKK
jgi:drug/metabolite transporter (DMT)-like permease